jgi:hypothetical protein
VGIGYIQYALMVRRSQEVKETECRRIIVLSREYGGIHQVNQGRQDRRLRQFWEAQAC